MSSLDIDTNTRCLIIGSGEMGRAHMQAFHSLIPGKSAGFARTEKNKEEVEKLGLHFYSGDLDVVISEFKPTHIVIASPVEILGQLTKHVLSSGIKHILIEKPAVLSVNEGNEIMSLAESLGAKLWVAYNRRFYSSVRKALKLIEESGESISNVLFEFTEWSHVIEALDNQSRETKANWVLANSMHVIDAALHPVGMPDLKNSIMIAEGALDWHPAASVFVGAGKTVKNVPYSYCANWDAPGRWWFEWITPSKRYIFRPLEKLHVTERATVAIDEIPLDDDLDTRFKPGVYMQAEQFLLDNPMGRLVPYSEGLKLVSLAQDIAGYK